MRQRFQIVLKATQAGWLRKQENKSLAIQNLIDLEVLKEERGGRPRKNQCVIEGVVENA